MLRTLKNPVAALLLISMSITGMASAADSFVNRAGQKAVSFTAEMGRFYTAVSVVTYWDCVSENDPVKCQAFNDSLKDPHTYIGFSLFVLAAQGSGKLTAGLPGSQAWGRYLGMTAGMFVSDLYGEFVAHPLTKELRATSKIADPEKRSERRKEIMAKLWADSLANKEWWENKVPQLAGLFGGFFVSSLVIPTTVKGLKGAEAMIELTHSQTAKKVAFRIGLARAGLEAFREAVMGAKGRVHPVALVAGQIAELIFFIKFSEWIEHPVRKWWNESRSVHALHDKVTGFDRRFSRMEFVEKSFDWEKEILAVEAAWDRYRSSQFEAARGLQGAYVQEASAFEKQLTDLYLYDQWIATGMSESSPLIRENGLGWEPGSKKDQLEHLHAFFCGTTPLQAITRAKDIGGLPVPGRTHDELSPFRVVNQSELCAKFPTSIIPSRARDTDIMVFGRSWMANLQANDHSAAVDRAFAQVMPEAQEIRRLLIERYEERISETLINNLKSGRDGSPRPQRDIEIEGHRYARGVIPSYDQEHLFWKRMDERYGKHTDVFRKAMSRTQTKYASAMRLLNYLEAPANSRVAPQDNDGLDLFASEESPDWEKVVQQWKSFVIRSIPAEAFQAN